MWALIWSRRRSTNTWGFRWSSWRPLTEVPVVLCVTHGAQKDGSVVLYANLLSVGFSASWSDTEWSWLGCGTMSYCLFLIIFEKKRWFFIVSQCSWLCVTYWSYLIQTINNLHLITLYKASQYYSPYFAMFMLKFLWDTSWFPKPNGLDGCLWWTIISACVLAPNASTSVPPSKQCTRWTPSDPVVFANRLLITRLISALFRATKPKPLSAMLHLESGMHFLVIVITALWLHQRWTVKCGLVPCAVPQL